MPLFIKLRHSTRDNSYIAGQCRGRRFLGNLSNLILNDFSNLNEKEFSATQNVPDTREFAIFWLVLVTARRRERH